MFRNNWEKIKAWYRSLPDKKRYVEFITALLTVPVLLTVLISNFYNLRNNNQQNTKVTPTSTEKVVIITTNPSPTSNFSPTVTPTPTVQACKKVVGPVKITKPVEGELVTTDSVCVEVSYDDSSYCSVNWAYRVNGGDWSNFNNNNFCLYNLTPGPKELDLDVKSTVSSDELTLIRNFYYKNKVAPTANPTTTPTPTSQ